MAQTHLQIITPQGIFFDEQIDIVTVKTTEGEMGLLHGKSPVVASLAIADLHIGPKNKAGHRPCAIAGGLLYVTPTSVRIITDAIEFKDEINLHRAEEAKHKAEALLKSQTEESDILKTKLALNKAINRINVSKGNF